jgi:hypothetical protein
MLLLENLKFPSGGGISFTQWKELIEERGKAFIPCINFRAVRIEPPLLLPQGRERKQSKTNIVFTNSSNGEGAAHLKELLQRALASSLAKMG